MPYDIPVSFNYTEDLLTVDSGIESARRRLGDRGGEGNVLSVVLQAD